MKAGNADLDQRIAELLADPAHAGHPLREALEALWRHTADQMARIERVTQLSDAYQTMAHEREIGLCDRFDRQLRRLTRIARISDHYQSMMRDLNAARGNVQPRPLTGLLNRRALMETIKQEVQRVGAAASPSSWACWTWIISRRSRPLRPRAGDRALGRAGQGAAPRPARVNDCAAAGRRGVPGAAAQYRAGGGAGRHGQAGEVRAMVIDVGGGRSGSRSASACRAISWERPFQKRSAARTGPCTWPSRMDATASPLIYPRR